MELEKNYNHLTEGELYKKWEASGYFNPDNCPSRSFRADGKARKKDNRCIPMPPPNATGVLHIGHALFVTIEDIMARYFRLQGHKTLWLPGTDHASIATQNKVEKIIAAEGLTRQKMGRKKFLERVAAFVEGSQATIHKQLRVMGASCDWSRERFTLDKGLSAAVKEMFVRMYNDDLIYRGYRIVNWCPRCASTLADDEVEYTPKQAKLYTFKYSHDFPIAIATTRPETKLGDTGVAVHPDDERYKQYIGQTFTIDLGHGPQKIKVFGDAEVDKEFGTGAVGVTPAHSQADYAWAQKHGLEIVKIIGEDGRMLNEAGIEYGGLTVEEARTKFVKWLETKGLMIKTEDAEQNLSICYRCSTPVEPLTSRQWFVAVDKPTPRLNGRSLKQASIEAVTSGQLKFVPAKFEKIYLNWMNNLHDWCISRQLWYGHRIPVWYCSNPECAPIASIKTPKSCPHCQNKKLTQDEDTLDTWFSSGMWTFSTLGWPKNFKDGKKKGDLAKFHPAYVLETAYDIIFFWVARMILMAEYALNEIPFKYVYMHGLVRDDQNRKLSKSLGNAMDPLEMTDKFGADPVRLSLIMGTAPGSDSKMSENKINGCRNFVNKLWNISRFILLTATKENIATRPVKLSLADQWILARFNQTLEEITKYYDAFDYSLVAEKLYQFTWSDFADWYLEIAKIEKGKEAILFEILSKLLILWHPFAPYVTEEIYQNLKANGLVYKDFLMIEAWPKPAKVAKSAVKAEADMAAIMELISTSRNLRSANKIDPAKYLSAMLYAGSKSKLVNQQIEIVKKLARLSELTIKKSGKKIDKAVSAVCSAGEIFLLADAQDSAEDQVKKQKAKEELTQYIAKMEAKLNNAEYVSKAPPTVVEADRTRLAEAREKAGRL